MGECTHKSFDENLNARVTSCASKIKKRTSRNTLQAINSFRHLQVIHLYLRVFTCQCKIDVPLIGTLTPSSWREFLPLLVCITFEFFQCVTIASSGLFGCTARTLGLFGSGTRTPGLGEGTSLILISGGGGGSIDSPSLLCEAVRPDCGRLGESNGSDISEAGQERTSSGTELIGRISGKVAHRRVPIDILLLRVGVSG